jgi:flagellar basal body-associated protein FliL
MVTTSHEKNCTFVGISKLPMDNANIEPENKEPEEKERRNRFLVIIIIILLLLVIILGWQYWNERQTVVEKIKIVEVDKYRTDSLTTDLISLQGQYASLKTNNSEIQSQLDSKKDTITMLMQQAEKYKNDPYIIAQLRKETATLRKVMQGFVHTIDSLNTLNQQLTSERNVAVQSLNEEKKTTTELKKEKGELQDKIVQGSLLQATAITTQGVFFRFGKKEVTTEKSRKAEKLKVQFTIAANRITQSGNKNIYIQVISPDAKELSKTGDESNLFNFEGTKGFYSGMQSIDYANQEMTLSIYCESSTGFVQGKYIIKIYADEAEIGESTLSLK